MSLSVFHPVVARWFAETLGEPTAAQARGWPAIRAGRHTLIAAPTGSGKTLAAFLTVLDDLFQEGLRAPLADEVRVVYVSPLKALSADVHKNLAEPRRGIRRIAEEMGIAAPRITAAVRTGDTTTAERAAMLRTPPHILVTTPESLYLLLTAARTREMLRTVRTVIIDEIHAVIGTRRGAHLGLSLERLEQVVAAPVVRIGLSATQKPIDEVARYLVGVREVSDPTLSRLRPRSDSNQVQIRPDPEAAATQLRADSESTLSRLRPNSDPVIVDEGHRRHMDLGIELPNSPLETVMSTEVWAEYYDQLAALIATHRTTLVFVNTRRLAERLARHLTDRLGEDAVTAHHGSLSRDKRQDAESRLKAGTLKALVATASLELGIDIGSVDLVCQIGSPHRIATFLQRVGRSGHTLTGVPKGRLFPISRDDLIECAALLRAVRNGELDAIVRYDQPLDVLTQQLVAEASCREYSEDELFDLVRRAWPYRALARADFDAVLAVASDGFATRRGRRSALIHRDEVNKMVRGRRGARQLAITSGGAIPEVADYRVVLDPEETFIGTVNEDFAIESMAGDIFQLGNTSWRILQVGRGVVRVADARGMPPTIPFWFGEAPARSDELSRAVSDLRAEVERQLAAHDAPEPIVEWFATATGVSIDAAIQAVMYFAEARRALGVLPTQDTLVVERFFDEAGGMQLVLHAPFGSRVNKAWGLALRKRFCRQFNFELQAAATEDALLLSLGPQHSFPLADVFRYLHPATARDVLVQAFLDAPVFQTRWRWNTTISLAVPRNRSGRKVAPQIQRMLADDLLAAVFPDAAACLENIPGDRQIPDHPLVNQTVRDCLQEAMDFEALAQILGRIHRGEIRCIACDTPEPSVLAHDILNARPYAFLDDAPLEERRTQAVYSRRTTEPSTGSDLGALDPAAIERVRDEQAVDARDADELHDALMTGGFLSSSDVAEIPREFFDELIAARRATAVHPLSESNPSRAVWIAAERIPEYQAIHGNTVLSPRIEAPASRASRAWTREQAAVELLRGRLTLVGPTTARELAASLSISEADVDAALLALESEGAVLRGFFRTAVDSPRPLEWCDRRLLARIHRYTLDRLRSEIEPVSPAAFMRFLFSWQHVDEATSLLNVEGVRAAIAALDGFEVAAAAWEAAILPARVDRYDASMLDSLSLTGEIAWGRLSATSPSTEGGTRLVGTTPVALFLREHAEAWYALKHSTPSNQSAAESSLSDSARSVLETLRRRGASFAHELGARSGSGTGPTGVGYRSDTTPTGVGYRSDTGRSGVGHRSEWGRSGVGVGSDTGRNGVGYKSDTGRNGVGHVSDPDPVAAIAELAAAGLVTSDGFAGLRLLVRGGSTFRGGPAGRWSAISLDESTATRERAVEAWAWALLRRYGVVFRRLLTREPALAPWRELTRVYRRLEARGEIRGGRFVAGMSGEQFALPDAVERLREVRRTPPNGRLITISAADPLNLAGIVTAGERVRAAASTRMAFCDGVAIAVMEGDYIRQLAEIESDKIADVASALAGRRVPAVAAGYVGRY